MKTGQSTTSSLRETENLITTSTTYSRYAELATDESKTGHSKGLRGVMLDSNRGRARKGVWARLLLVLNDLLPRFIRPIKSKRGIKRRWYGWRTALLSFRINWRAIYKRKLMNKLGLRHGK